jgi:Fe-S cluster assembly protein SufD
MIFKDLTTSNEHRYTISKPGDYLYLICNKSIDALINLSAPNINLKFFGIYLGQKKDKYKINLVQNHTSSNTNSHSVIKSVMKNQASFEYNGLIKIDTTSRDINAFQTNKNLLLSNDAKITTNPSLEIMNNNVKCSHSSSTLRPTSEYYQYLAARGIDKGRANELYVNGFISDFKSQVLKYIHNESEEFQKKVMQSIKKNIINPNIK